MIGSINGRLAEPVHSCYDSSKGAIDAMVRSLCVSLAPLGIRVNGLAPGLVRTPLTAVIDNELRLRDDVVNDGNVRDDVLKNAPDAQHGFFAVPKVIE